VNGYEGAGEYEINLNYDIGLEWVVNVINASTYCQQHLRWECKATIIHNPRNPVFMTTFWSNRTGSPMLYFPGGSPGSSNCSCGETWSCVDTSLACNCDINNLDWNFDEGYVTSMSDLPITKFSAGDTGRWMFCGFLLTYSAHIFVY
jgi:hypothetical protein